MSINKEKLRYILTQLKKQFVTKKELNVVTSKLDQIPEYELPVVKISIHPEKVLPGVPENVTIRTEFIQNDAGDIIEFTLRKNNNILMTDDKVTDYVDYVLANADENIIYTASVKYADGVVKETVLGVPYPDTSIKSNIKSSEVTLNVIPNSYMGIVRSDNSFEIIETVNIANNIYQYMCDLNDEKLVFMYPKSFGLTTTIRDVNGLEYIDSYDVEVVMKDNIEYYKYTLKDNIMISNFIQIFN